MTTVLHVLDHSRPLQSGYATRSHSILTSLVEAGFPVLAMTGPKHAEVTGDAELIEDVSYVRSPGSHRVSAGGVSGQLQTIRLTRQALQQMLRENDVGLVHAHSPCLNALAAIRTGVPFVYEMRSSWEDAAVSEGVTTEGSLRYRASRYLESFVVRRSAHNFVICDGLRRELLERGVSKQDITVVPNAIQEDLLNRPSDTAVNSVIEKHGLAGRKVIGYYGSFFDWEGVDVLVEVLPAVVDAVPDAVLLLAGSGRTEQDVRDLVARKKLDQHVLFAGRVDAAEMPAYYQAADVMVYPRKSHRLTEMVTPLKPLEAMAQCTPVIASDIGGHRELIRDNVTGFLVNIGEAGALSSRVVDVLSRDVTAIVASARRFVEEERRWSVVVDQYRSIYEQFGINGGR